MIAANLHPLDRLSLKHSNRHFLTPPRLWIRTNIRVVQIHLALLDPLEFNSDTAGSIVDRCISPAQFVCVFVLSQKFTTARRQIITTVWPHSFFPDIDWHIRAAQGVCIDCGDDKLLAGAARWIVRIDHRDHIVYYEYNKLRHYARVVKWNGPGLCADCYFADRIWEIDPQMWDEDAILDK